jgi:hypothetical protein
VEPYRQRTEDIIRRYWHEGNRVLRVLAVPAAIGAVLVVGGWLLLTPLTIPRFSTDGPVELCLRSLSDRGLSRFFVYLSGCRGAMRVFS